MSKRIFSLVMCIVIALSLLGVGCDDKKEDAMADNSSLDEIYSSEVSSLNNAINDSSSKESSKDEYAFENAPEGEEYDFGDNGLGAYFPSFGESSSGNQNASNDDIFNIEDIPSFNATPSNKPSNTSSNNTSSTRKPTNPLYIDKTLSFSPLTATHDGLLDNNPDRGYRTEMVLYIKHKESEKDDPRTAYVNESKAEIRRRVEKVFDIYFKKNYSTNKTFLAYIYITDFRNDSISNAAPVLEMFFQICREKKVKSMLRFCYNNSYAKNFELSQENKDKLASECADQKTILRHIDELAPYIKKYSDTIHTISCGFIGFVGEWAYHYQYPIVDYPTVMKAIVEKLCVPNGLYFSIRHPEYKSRLGSSYKYNNYISYNNDAMYGEQRNYNWNSGNYQIGTDGWWEKVTNVAAYTPQDGEMYTNDVLIDRYNMVPKGLDVILECAHHRHTSMSNWHGYLEALHRDNIITRWKNNETVTTSWLKSKKIIYDPNWFLDDNGNTVKRNPYVFLKDHLGYKLVAVGGNVKGTTAKGNTLNLELKLKNYGFAAAYMLSSGFAILDSNFKEVSSIKAGSPEKWYSHAPDNSATSTVLTHTVKADIKLPSSSGKYYIAFYLKNTMNDRARLSNQLSFQNGYNILFSIEL